MRDTHVLVKNMRYALGVDTRMRDTEVLAQRMRDTPGMATKMKNTWSDYKDEGYTCSGLARIHLAWVKGPEINLA